MAAPKDQSISVIKREAIDSNGHLGSLYDAYRDCIVRKLDVNSQAVSSRSDQIIRCTLKSGNQDQTQNLIELFDIEDELRLSILLKLTHATNMTSFTNYHHQIDKNTRILHYIYVNSVEQLSENEEIARQFITLPNLENNVTHIITSISWGIDIYVVIQLPFDTEIVKQIDSVLKKIQLTLNDNKNDLQLTIDEESLLDNVIETRCYSNIPDLSNRSILYNICRFIQQNKNNNIRIPIQYILRPIAWLHPSYKMECNIFFPLSLYFNDQLEKYALRMQSMLAKLEIFVGKTLVDVEYGCSKNVSHQITTKYSNLRLKCMTIMNQLSQLLLDARSGKIDNTKLRELLNANVQQALKDDIDEAVQNVHKALKKKESSINLKRKAVDNSDAEDDNTNMSNFKKKPIRTTRSTNKRLSLRSSKNSSNCKTRSQLNTTDVQHVKEHKEKSPKRSADEDSPSSSCEISNTLLSSKKRKRNEDESKSELPLLYGNRKTAASQRRRLKTSDSEVRSKPETAEASSSITQEISNILLLGETGVGKSTFINAFVNYLEFNTLENAQSNKPVVLIPVTFLMTVGDNFEERIIKFGDIDNDINEDFNHPGQSVTQKCRSYLFNLKQNNKQQLCIIDTPGFGDTRGVDQDELNMQHILEYVNNLTHLNAVCFLLKPNSSRLNIFFRSCFTQLFNLLGSNALQNLIFCFTNTRSTFYAPGDTLPLLKQMLGSLSIGDIPLKKENTFCFDSESFRYLVSLQNGIVFDELDRKEYENSWSTSVKESNRLIKYICMNLNQFHMKNKCQSTKDAQLQINRMMRPILETIRNVLRNIVLSDVNCGNKSIELCPKVIHRPATLCLKCKQNIIQCDNFWFTEEIPHEFHNECLMCSCSFDEHISIDYIVKLKLVDIRSKYNVTEMNEQLTVLCDASATFTYFLLYVIRSTNKDEFLINLKRVIDEEKAVCPKSISNGLNSQLLEYFDEFERVYEEKLKKITLNPVDKELKTIYEWINKIKEIPLIEEQLGAIEKGHEAMMAKH